jgi:UDP-glucuronate decarboxylase
VSLFPVQSVYMKTILVTGGAGFIGSHVCEALLDQGHRVVCVDNFLTSSRQNIEPFLTHPQFTLVVHDIIEPFFVDEPVDMVVNLACPASPVHYQHNAIRTIKANTIGVINMLGLAKKHGAVFLQASTSEVYGDPEVHPQVEEYRGNVSCTGPRACYDEGKRCAETLCFDYERSHGLRVKVIRIFNTYGPRMLPDDGRVVSNMIVQAIKNEPITLYGDGTQTRSFCYVDDLVRGILAMLFTPDHVTGPLNLGNPEEYTIAQLASRIMSLTGSSSPVVHKDLPQDDPTRRKPDVSKAQSMLQWAPSVSLDDGLTKTIAYFRSVIV